MPENIKGITPKIATWTGFAIVNIALFHDITRYYQPTLSLREVKQIDEHHLLFELVRFEGRLLEMPAVRFDFYCEMCTIQ